jgi:hypothetical protein
MKSKINYNSNSENLEDEGLRLSELINGRYDNVIHVNDNNYKSDSNIDYSDSINNIFNKRKELSSSIASVASLSNYNTNQSILSSGNHSKDKIINDDYNELDIFNANVNYRNYLSPSNNTAFCNSNSNLNSKRNSKNKSNSKSNPTKGNYKSAIYVDSYLADKDKGRHISTISNSNTTTTKGANSDNTIEISNKILKSTLYAMNVSVSRNKTSSANNNNNNNNNSNNNNNNTPFRLGILSIHLSMYLSIHTSTYLSTGLAPSIYLILTSLSIYISIYL